jgi:hypothetical protein
MRVSSASYKITSIIYRRRGRCFASERHSEDSSHRRSIRKEEGHSRRQQVAGCSGLSNKPSIINPKFSDQDSSYSISDQEG